MSLIRPLLTSLALLGSAAPGIAAQLGHRGAAQDGDAFGAMTPRLAFSGERPTWSAGSELKAGHDASAAQRR